MQGTTAARDVHLLVDHVLPDLFQRRPQGIVANFCVEVSDSRVEIGGSHRVADRFGLLRERHAILVVVSPVHRQVAHFDQSLREIQVTGFSGGAIQIEQSHVVGWADRMSRLFRRWIAVGIVEKVSGSLCDAEQTVFAGHLMVDACRGHQVPHVVHLEVEAIANWLDTVIAISVCDQDRCVEVTIASLCFANDPDDFVESLVPDMILVDGLKQANCLHPLVEVTVVERRPAVPAFCQPGRDAEMFQIRLVLGATHDLPHRWDRLFTTSLQALGPETVGPVHVPNRDWFNRAKRKRRGRLSVGIADAQTDANVDCKDVASDSHDALSDANGVGEVK